MVEAPAHGPNHLHPVICGRAIHPAGSVAPHGGEKPGFGTDDAQKKFNGLGKVLGQFAFRQKIQPPMAVTVETKKMPGSRHFLRFFGREVAAAVEPLGGNEKDSP